MTAPQPAVPGAVRVPSVHGKSYRVAAVVTLIGLGVLLIGFGIGLWLLGGSGPASTTTGHTTTSQVTTGSESSTGSTTSTPTETQPKPPDPNSTTKNRSKTSVDSSQTTSGGGPATRSESLVLGVVGGGLVLLLCGIFFSRIQEVTLPGGIGVKLGDAAQAKLAEKAADEAKTNNSLEDDPATIGNLYEIALGILTEQTQPALSETPTGYYVAGPPMLADISESKASEIVKAAAEQLAE